MIFVVRFCFFIQNNIFPKIIILLQQKTKSIIWHEISDCRRIQTKALPFSQFRMNRMSSRERLRDHPRFDYGTRYFDVGEKANVVVSIGSHVCRELCSILVSYCTTRKSVAGLTLTMGKVFYVGKFYNIYQTLILGPAILSLALFTVCK